MRNWVFSEYVFLAGLILGWTYRFDNLKNSLISLLVVITIIQIIILAGLICEEKNSDERRNN